MRHDTGAGRELIRQFDEAKVLAIEHTSIKRKFRNGPGNSGKCKSYITLHFATPHLGVYHIIIQRIKTKQTSRHRTVQWKRGAITGS